MNTEAISQELQDALEIYRKRERDNGQCLRNAFVWVDPDGYGYVTVSDWAEDEKYLSGWASHCHLFHDQTAAIHFLTDVPVAPRAAEVDAKREFDIQRAAEEEDQARAQENVEGDPEGVAEYVEHEFALREYEGEKLNRLKIMTWAQSVRTRFLKLSMADRKIFLDVLTANEGGSMSRMFALQATVEANNCDDDQLAITAAVNRLNHRENSLPDALFVIHEQRYKKKRRAKLLESSSQPELPAGRALNLLEESHE